MKILSFGAGMQSTALALMACENVDAERKGRKRPYPLVPVYDLVIFCDLGFEPPWVMEQAEFVHRACDVAGIRYEMLDTPLYKDFLTNFGERRTVSIPWWTLRDDGHKSKMPRNCTIDYKVEAIAKFVRRDVLGYKKFQRLRDEDKKAHEMHMGFGAEEQRRCKPSPNSLFVNRFPLAEMGLTREDNYAYIRDVWGLKTRASACCFCPFHCNYFYKYLKEHEPLTYERLVQVDNLLEEKIQKPPMDSDLFITRNRKRIDELTPEECCDAKYFRYHGKKIWDGF